MKNVFTRMALVAVALVGLMGAAVGQPPPGDPGVNSQYTITYQTSNALPMCWGIDSNIGVLTSTLDSGCKTGYSIGAGGSAVNPKAPGNGYTATVRVKFCYTAAAQMGVGTTYCDVNSGLWSAQVPVTISGNYLTSYYPVFQQQKTDGSWEDLATGGTVAIIYP